MAKKNVAVAAKSAVVVKFVPRHQRMTLRKAIRQGKAALRLIGTTVTGYILAGQRPSDGAFVSLFGSETKFPKMAQAVAFGERKCQAVAKKVVG